MRVESGGMQLGQAADTLEATEQEAVLAKIFPSLGELREIAPTEQRTGVVVGADGRGRPPWAAATEQLREYYDNEWGLPLTSEKALFELLSLEVFQAGLSWRTVLAKRDALWAAFSGFDPDRVSRFAADDVARLLENADLIRNQQKIWAVITNARATVQLRQAGGLAKLVWEHQPEVTPTPVWMEDLEPASAEAKALTAALKTHGFTFVGPRTVYAFMQAAGVVDANLTLAYRRGASGLWNPDGTRAARPDLGG